MSEEANLTIKKDTLWKYSTFLLIVLLIVGGFVFFLGGNNNQTTGNVVANIPQPTGAATQPLQVREKGGDEAYFKMHDKIFQEGNKLDGGDPIIGPVRGTAQFGATELKNWAKDLGYNIDSCLDSSKYASEIQKDLADGQAAGGQGTPYFVINGKPLSGAQPYAAF